MLIGNGLPLVVAQWTGELAAHQWRP